MIKLWNPKRVSTAPNPCLSKSLLLETPLFSALTIDTIIFSQWPTSKCTQLKKEKSSDNSGHLKNILVLAGYQPRFKYFCHQITTMWFWPSCLISLSLSFFYKIHIISTNLEGSYKNYSRCEVPSKVNIIVRVQWKVDSIILLT